MSLIDERIRTALDSLCGCVGSRGDGGEGFLVLLRFLERQIAGAFHKYGAARRGLEPEDLLHTVVFAVSDDWCRKPRTIRTAAGWVRVVARNKCIDFIRGAAKWDISGQDPDDVGDPDPPPPMPEQSFAVVLEDFFRRAPESLREVIYLMRVRRFSQSQAARRLLEIEQVTLKGQMELAERVVETEEYLGARSLRLSEATSILLAPSPSDWVAFRTAEGLPEVDPQALKKKRNSVGNLAREGRYQIHHLMEELIPEQPPELRELWRERYPDKSQSARGVQAAAEALGLDPAKARDLYEQLCIHLPVKVPWS